MKTIFKPNYFRLLAMITAAALAVGALVVAEGHPFAQTTSIPVTMPADATLNQGERFKGQVVIDYSIEAYNEGALSGTLNYGDGTGDFDLIALSGIDNNKIVVNLSHVYFDPGTYTITVNVADNQGATGSPGVLSLLNSWER